MFMSIVYSELSLDYGSALGGANQISLFRVRTNDNNTGLLAGLFTNPLDAVPLSLRHLFEIQVVLSGDTGRVIRNDFGAGYTRMDSPKRLTHRVEHNAADPAGSVAGTLICNVNVRRISYHTDSYSRQMTLNHAVTTVGSSGGGAPPPPPPGGIASGLGLQDTYADWPHGDSGQSRLPLIRLKFTPNGQVLLSKRYPTAVVDMYEGAWGDISTDGNQFEILAEYLPRHVLDTPPSINGMPTWTRLNVERFLELEAVPNGPGTYETRYTNVRFTIRPVGNPAAAISKLVEINVYTNQGGGGGGGDQSDIPF